MKLLATFETWEEATKLVNFLQDKGIIAELEHRTHVMGYGSLGRVYQVSAALDEQYEDALALMKNPDHVVANPMDPEDFQHYMDDNKSRMFALNQIMNVVVPLVLILFVGLFALYLYFIKHYQLH